MPPNVQNGIPLWNGIQLHIASGIQLQIESGIQLWRVSRIPRLQNLRMTCKYNISTVVKNNFCIPIQLVLLLVYF